MKNIFTKKKFLRYRWSRFLLVFQAWINENILTIFQNKYCIKHKTLCHRMLSRSCKEHVTSVTLMKNIFYLLKVSILFFYYLFYVFNLFVIIYTILYSELEVNRVVPIETEKEKLYVWFVCWRKVWKVTRTMRTLSTQ